MNKMILVWESLSTSPLLWLIITLLAYLGSNRLYRFSGRHTLLHPLPVTIVGLAIVLTITKTPYPIYFEHAQFIHFLLGPTTVALALPLYL